MGGDDDLPSGRVLSFEAGEGPAGIPLQVGFNRRYDAGFRAAHDKIAAASFVRIDELKDQ